MPCSSCALAFFAPSSNLRRTSPPRPHELVVDLAVVSRFQLAVTSFRQNVLLDHEGGAGFTEALHAAGASRDRHPHLRSSHLNRLLEARNLDVAWVEPDRRDVRVGIDVPELVVESSAGFRLKPATPSREFGRYRRVCTSLIGFHHKNDLVQHVDLRPLLTTPQRCVVSAAVSCPV